MGRALGWAECRWSILVLAGMLAAASLATAQVRSADATRASHAPKWDGTLDDPLWNTAEAIADFRQREPLETQPASERTEVRILYDSHHVYFGIHCYDREANRIVATQLRRDLSVDFDDNFA